MKYPEIRMNCLFLIALVIAVLLLSVEAIDVIKGGTLECPGKCEIRTQSGVCMVNLRCQFQNITENVK